MSTETASTTTETASTTTTTENTAPYSYALEGLDFVEFGTKEFKITTYNSDYKPTKVGGTKFTVTMHEADTKKEKKIEIKDNNDGTYTGTYSLTKDEAKDHIVEISYQNAQGESKHLSTNPWKPNEPFVLPFLDISFTTTYPDAYGYKIPYVIELSTNQYASHIGFEKISYNGDGRYNWIKPYIYNITEKAEKGWYRFVRGSGGGGNNDRLLSTVFDYCGLKATGSSGHSSTDYPEGARKIPMVMYGGWSLSSDYHWLKMELFTDPTHVGYYMDEIGAYVGTPNPANTKYEGGGVNAWTPGVKGDFYIAFQTTSNEPAFPPKAEVKIEMNHTQSKTPIPFEIRKEHYLYVDYTPPTGLELGEIKVDMFWDGKLVNSKSIYAWGLFVADWQPPADSSSSSSEASSSSSWTFKPNQILSVEHSKFSFVGFDSATVNVNTEAKKLSIDIYNPYVWFKESKAWLHFSWDKEGKLAETISKEVCSAIGLTYEGHEDKNIVSEWAGFQGTKAATYDSEKGLIAFPEILYGLKKITASKSL